MSHFSSVLSSCLGGRIHHHFFLFLFSFSREGNKKGRQDLNKNSSREPTQFNPFPRAMKTENSGLFLGFFAFSLCALYYTCSLNTHFFFFLWMKPSPKPARLTLFCLPGKILRFHYGTLRWFIPSDPFKLKKAVCSKALLWHHLYLSYMIPSGRSGVCAVKVSLLDRKTSSCQQQSQLASSGKEISFLAASDPACFLLFATCGWY